MRSITKVLEVINEVFEGVLGKTPSYNTIGNWIKKYGLDVYKTSAESLKNQDYAAVVDESMMIGSQKLLLTLAVPSKHQQRPLRHDDVTVIDMSVLPSWKGEDVKNRIEKAANKTGHFPKYVISDNAQNIIKGTRLLGVSRHCDISHTLGVCLERTYNKADDFKEYLKSMTAVKFKYNMTKVAYLLPPTQRTVARFINLSCWVKWSSKMLNIYNHLSSEEKEVFSFIPHNASLIEELTEIMTCVGNIEEIFKHQGLSKKTINQCQLQVRRILMSGNERMIKFACSIRSFLDEEDKILESDDDVRNNSSDIIESIFGSYKARKSPNKLHGVTPFVLFIPAHTQLLKMEAKKNYHFKERLERVRLKEIEHWKSENLSPNLVVKRIALLKKAG